MKKSNPAFVCVVGACALAGMALGQNHDSAGKYRVGYEWSAGTLPPRYHYQYRIEIDPSGQGNIVMVPEYPTIYDMDIPRWKETFSIDAEQMRKLTAFIEANKMLSPEWQDAPKREASAAAAPGSASCRIDIRTDAQDNRIPCNEWEVPPALHKKKDELVDMVKKLVPAKSWARLNDAQRQYINHG